MYSSHVDPALGASVNSIIAPFNSYAAPGSWNTPFRKMNKLFDASTAVLSDSREKGWLLFFKIKVFLLLSKNGAMVSRSVNFPK